MHAFIVEIDSELNAAQSRVTAVGHVIEGACLRIGVDVWFDAHCVKSPDQASRTMKPEGIFV